MRSDKKISQNRYSGSVTLLILACFFLSGLAGLIYEVVWARQLSLFLGITSYAHTAVITAYMAGLAAGSLYFGRRADRHHEPLKVYAWLEIGVGLYAALTPWLFTGLQHGYISIAEVTSIGTTSGHLTRFAVALLALLVPTFLMGGTLPLLVRGFVTELPSLGKITGRFYGINTLGAVTGTVLAGYLLIPKLGLKLSILTGAGINLAIAVVILLLLQKKPATDTGTRPGPVEVKRPAAHTNESYPARFRLVVFAGFGAAGFAALLAQMAWIRALILVVGGSVYAFTITLASFLAGIGLGSLIYTRFLAADKGQNKNSWQSAKFEMAAILALSISLALLLGLPVTGKLPGWFMAGYAAGLHSNFAVFQLFIFALCASVIALPTVFMGILFPLMTAIWTPSLWYSGRGVGSVYAINTAGTVLGALVGGLFLLPWLGVHGSILVAATIYLLVATAYWFVSAESQKPLKRVIAAILVLVFSVLAWSLPPWNKLLMVSGVFSFPDRLAKQLPGSSLETIVERNELVYYAEGLDGIVAVRRSGNDRALVINGKADASSREDLPTQILLGQLPLALDRRVNSALVIGLGSGITAGTIATSDQLNSMTILEISKEVVEASSYFRAENRNVLADPRVSLVTADARNYLMASADTYDLIVSEPSNPWITGISNLFTDEFFKLAKKRLNPGGVMTQWFHTYGMSNDDLRSVLKTFAKHFAYVSLWSPVFEDIIIMGSNEPHAIAWGQSNNQGESKRMEELERAQVFGFRDLVRLYLMGGELVSDYASGAEINSDNYPVIEFNAPKNLYADTTQQNTTSIFEYLDGRSQSVPITGLVGVNQSGVDASFMGLQILGRDAISSIEPHWLIRQLLVEDKGRKIYGFIDTGRVLSWKEGSNEFTLSAREDYRQWRGYIPATEPPPEFAGSGSGWALIAAKPDLQTTESGFINLQGLGDTSWKKSRNQADTATLLELIWDCPSEISAATQFHLFAKLPGPDSGSKPVIPVDIAEGLSCHH
jgi:spermidine synthase